MSLSRPLPAALAALRDLALDLRWTWSHEADALWERLDAEMWHATHNPWAILEDVPAARLRELAADAEFCDQLERLVAARNTYLSGQSWFARHPDAASLPGIAFFSMEFGLGDALPLYAGGLGILAGDFLKAASDLGVPVIGVGLLYQEGYFHQMIDADGRQHEAFPFNDPAMMPIEPVIADDGSRLHIPVALPGRTVLLRVWRATVGRCRLYLLDSNDPRNSPADRGITGKLYGDGGEMRLMQELVLGIGGWRAITALHPDVAVCHLNEGHAAFVTVERARQAMQRAGLSFAEAWWVMRAGTVFTTHTPVAAGFDRFSAALIDKYLTPPLSQDGGTGVTPADIVALAQANAHRPLPECNMASLAVNGSLISVGVSRLHGQMSRQIFQSMFPRWPTAQVPIGHVTNGVHVPTWDSRQADAIWTDACGKERWREQPEDVGAQIEMTSDEALWALCSESRHDLVTHVRARLSRQLQARGQSPEAAAAVLDPNVLTFGFARRFTAYKRPNLLLHDPERFSRILDDARRPVQIVVAGKAHPADRQGKAMIQDWLRFAAHPDFRRRIVFLEDYDISLAQLLVQGVDVWVNTPRRPWEACGTSGMKVLVNGGLNLSELDGWWDEAYAPGLGWAIGHTAQPDDATQDAQDAAELYAALEHDVIPAFYDRDAAGLPRGWLARVRRSMRQLTQRFCATRMVGDYVTQAYLPAAEAHRMRGADGGAAARAMRAWHARVTQAWPSLHIGEPAFTRAEATWRVSVPVYLGDMAPGDVQVELYADGDPPALAPLARGAALAGATAGFLYAGAASADRPADAYTVRIVPFHPGVRVPTECQLIAWQR